MECPSCKIPLVEELPPSLETADKSISYEALVDLVRENGGQLETDLSTTDVGIERTWGFPYLGYKFAWAKRMHGHVGGNEVTLAAKRVARERMRDFPWRGYGFAWTQELSGECGEQLKVNLLITDVGRKRGWRFPYLGYGSAWANKGVLTLILTEQP